MWSRGLIVVLACASGCLPRALLEQAIRARGGPLPALARDSEAVVSFGYPGTWRWHTVVAPPDRYAWTIETTGESTHYLFDGRVVRAFVGGALTSEDASPTAALRSHARFMGVLQLDGLRAAGVQVRELPEHERPAGAAFGLAAVFADTGDRYLIGLDPRRLVISIEGPVLLPPHGRQTLRVVLADHRRVDRYRVAHHAIWTVDGRTLADERMLAACPLERPLPAAAFASPGALPTCP